MHFPNTQAADRVGEASDHQLEAGDLLQGGVQLLDIGDPVEAECLLMLYTSVS